MARPDDEFYVGYLPQSPPGIARRTRIAVVVLLGLGLSAAALTLVAQRHFDAGTFEFGVERAFDGVLLERPYPILLVPDANGTRSHYLVRFGKHGAQGLVAGMDGDAVRVVGTAIHDDGQRMIQVERLEPLDAARAEALRARVASGEVALGTMTLIGEIVDSKCHLGVMKPGRGKPHQVCAIRCIAGGIPPVLRVEGLDGRVAHLLLVGRDGRAVNREVLDLVAEPVQITGRVVRAGDLLVLYADPADYRRLD